MPITERTYMLERDSDGTLRAFVAVPPNESRELPLRLDLVSHSPTGFEVGYGGSGPAQLALAILADALDDDKKALRLYIAFKNDVIKAVRLSPGEARGIRWRDVSRWVTTGRFT